MFLQCIHYSSVKQTECMHMCRSSTVLELRHYVSMFLNLVKIGNSVSFVLSLSPAYIWLEPTETISMESVKSKKSTTSDLMTTFLKSD